MIATDIAHFLTRIVDKQYDNFILNRVCLTQKSLYFIKKMHFASMILNKIIYHGAFPGGLCELI